MCVVVLFVLRSANMCPQFDESDTKNESYICFRRREIKAIRKTRTAQVSSSDKLIRLKGELLKAFELSKLLLSREALKDDVIPLSEPIVSATGETINAIPVKAGQWVILSFCGYHRYVSS